VAAWSKVMNLDPSPWPAGPEALKERTMNIDIGIEASKRQEIASGLSRVLAHS
jgi:hypothetical protein